MTTFLKEVSPGWLFIGRTDAEAETPVLWPPDAKNWLFEKTLMLGTLKPGREGDDRGWDGWMASLAQWTWVWVNSGSWWWTGRPGVLQPTGLQRVGHDWATELNWIEWLPQRPGMLQSIGLQRARHDWSTEQQQNNGYLEPLKMALRRKALDGVVESIAPLLSTHSWIPLIFYIIYLLFIFVKSEKI